MAKIMNIRQAKILALAVNAAFLAIHVFLFFLFRKHGVTPMMYFNIGSVLFYLLMTVFIHREMLRFFCVATYLEIVLHMSLAVYFTGWAGGFQVTLIGTSILTAYSEYGGRYLRVPYVRSAPLNILGMCAYLLMCVVNYHHAIPYALPERVCYLLSLTWGVITFSITIFYLHIFVQLTTRTEEILKREADHDQLTGLPNRYYLWDYFDRLDRERKMDGHWIAMVDIDSFKAINDTYGHNCGDTILRSLAEILQDSRLPMQVCRWGGEEFLLTGDTEGDYGKVRAELDRIRKAVETHEFVSDGRRLHLTVTIGLAAYPGSNVREWIGLADRRLYEGKSRGKNCVVS